MFVNNPLEPEPKKTRHISGSESQAHNFLSFSRLFFLILLFINLPEFDFFSERGSRKFSLLLINDLDTETSTQVESLLKYI